MSTQDGAKMVFTPPKVDPHRISPDLARSNEPPPRPYPPSSATLYPRCAMLPSPPRNFSGISKQILGLCSSDSSSRHVSMGLPTYTRGLGYVSRMNMPEASLQRAQRVNDT